MPERAAADPYDEDFEKLLFAAEEGTLDSVARERLEAKIAAAPGLEELRRLYTLDGRILKALAEADRIDTRRAARDVVRRVDALKESPPIDQLASRTVRRLAQSASGRRLRGRVRLSPIARLRWVAAPLGVAIVLLLILYIPAERNRPRSATRRSVSGLNPSTLPRRSTSATRQPAPSTTTEPDLPPAADEPGETPPPRLQTPHVTPGLSLETAESSQPVPKALGRRPEPGKLPAAPAPGDVPRTAAPGPAPAPETASPLARIAQLNGMVMVARGSQRQWVRAETGVALMSGDRLDTRTGTVRLDFEDWGPGVPAAGPAPRSGGRMLVQRRSASVYVNQATVLRALDARTEKGLVALIELNRGELYVDGSGRQIHVETSDGLISPAGTRFHVLGRRISTIVRVESGAVEMRGKPKAKRTSAQARPVDLRRRTWLKKIVRIEAGHEASVRQGANPSPPRPTRFRLAARWHHGLKRTREVLFHLDFEDGKRPELCKEGKVVAGPARPSGRFCAQGRLHPSDGHAVRFERRPHFLTFTRGLVLHFDCWLGPDAQGIRLLAWRARRPERYDFRAGGIPRETWTRVTVRLADLRRRREPTRSLADGDVLTTFYIFANKQTKGAFYVDNVKIARYGPDQAPPTSWSRPSP